MSSTQQPAAGQSAATTPTQEPSYEQRIWFEILYALNLEQLHGNLYERLGNLSTFLIILLGTAAAAQLSPTACGLAIAALGCWQVVYAPSARALKHQTQYRKYEELYHDFASQPVEESAERLKELRKTDNEALGALGRPAWNLAAVMSRSLDDKYDGLSRLGIMLMKISA